MEKRRRNQMKRKISKEKKPRWVWVEYCRCKEARLRINHVERTIYCSACGLVFDYHSNRDGVDVADNDTTVRLSDPINPSLSESGLSTEPKDDPTLDLLSRFLEYSPKPVSYSITIVPTESEDFLKLTLGDSHTRASHLLSVATTKTSVDVIVPIAAMSDRLGLPASVKIEASEIFNKVEDSSWGKEPTALFAACIYIACRSPDMIRTMAAISSVTDGATISDINIAIDFIAEELGIRAVDFIKGFCFYLGMDSKSVEAAEEAAKSYEMIDTRGRSAVSIAATVVYVIARLSTEKNLLKDIIQVSGVTENTIKDTFEGVYPNLSVITPKGFVNEKDLQNICCP